MYSDPSMKRTKSLINKIATKTLNIENCPIVHFIRTEKIEFLSDDALNIVKDNMNNEKCYIFFDPPYLLSCNEYYDNCTVEKNIYQYIYKNQTKLKCKYAFVINENWLTSIIFKDFNIVKYNKRYSSNKKATHMIITNP